MVLDMFRLDGQVAVVTGAGRGIGAASALALAEAGADVVLSARTEDQLQEVAKQVADLGRRAHPSTLPATGAWHEGDEVGNRRFVDVSPGRPFALEGGGLLREAVVAYETFGTLAPDGSNAVLVCHALTADQYLAEPHPLTGRAGWWQNIVGPGKPFDTDRYYVICTNVLGGCMGSTGPREEMTDAETGRGLGRPWGTDFPNITIRDMVRAQKLLVDRLGIERLLAVIGGSMGGMQVLEWAATFPDAVYAAAPIATAAYHSAQNIAFNEVGRAAIHSDPDWREGRYWEDGRVPAKGLSVARMVAHITYLSEEALTRKFGRRLRGASSLTFLEDVFEVESYLRHQGSTFVRRFDANSYLTITRAMDLILVARNLERVADLATNIAEEVVFIAEARIIKHNVEEAPTGGRPTPA